MQTRRTRFFGDGTFEWQFPSQDLRKSWKHYSCDPKRWWGMFPRARKAPKDLFKEYPWAVGPFTKFPGNPVLEPTRDAWDQGRCNGGVHNGAVVVKGGRFYYVYRGECPNDMPGMPVDYICDVGLAVSDDGVRFVKDDGHSPFFRRGEDRRYSYEDVNIARYGATYYLFCNQWYWPDQKDPRINGTFLATSRDLLHWRKVGIVFPQAERTHRNAVVLQGPDNEAVRVGGRFVMYINDGLIAYSEDMVHWTSRDMKGGGLRGECCFALADHCEDPDRIVLFTGGNHTGHFYAVGEELFSKRHPEKPLAYLPCPVLNADPGIPHESGFAKGSRSEFVSCFSDCVFFNGLTRHQGKWWLYYGGSEYYTCLATAPA